MFRFFPQQTSPLRQAITAAFRRDEAHAVADIFERLHTTIESRERANHLARELHSKIQSQPIAEYGSEAFLNHFTTDTPEGNAFLELIETLLLVPDEQTRTLLLRDKTSIGNWDKILKFLPPEHPSLLQRIAGKHTTPNDNDKTTTQRLRLQKAEQIIHMIANRFIASNSIEETTKKNKKREKSGYCFSFALPLQTAMNNHDAAQNYQKIIDAVHTLGSITRRMSIQAGHNLSLRLSSICASYNHLRTQEVLEDLLPKLKHLFFLAKEYQISLCIEAEESAFLELSLSIIEEIIAEDLLADYHGIGFTVQAYQKRAAEVIAFLEDLARKHHKRLMIRLVKGGQWENEIKSAQASGLNGYPIYTRQEHTDLAYLACAQMLLDAPDIFYPQFATHNPNTVAAIIEMAQSKEFEFQCLYGLGETLYNQLVGAKKQVKRCRIYVPIGEHALWSHYLVRRLIDYVLLRKTTNQNHEQQSNHPVDAVVRTQGRPNPAVPLPRYIYGHQRLNSIGIDFNDDLVLYRLQELLNIASENGFQATPITLIDTPAQEARFVQNPANHQDAIGAVSFIERNALHKVVSAAKVFETHWAEVEIAERVDCLNRLAELLENCLPEMMNLIIREAGKNAQDALDEIRRSVDYCRYYAREAQNLCLHRTPIGTVLVLSPWHSPLIALVAQSAAALVSGNTVIVKPAAQTCLIAYRAIQLFHACGVPIAALQLVLGDAEIGATLTQDERINGILFYGSTEAAKLINHTLGRRHDLPTFIAQTGGQNTIIADSSANLTQLCHDVIRCAFSSAGQHSNALRLLCVQEEIADTTINMLRGAMDNLHIGNPVDASVFVGPIIDQEAQNDIFSYLEKIKPQARSFYQSKLPTDLHNNSSFIAPTIIELDNIEPLQREIFGPILLVIRYNVDQLENLIEKINAKGYALACGIYSHSDSRIDHIAQNIDAGTIYTNHNIITAIPAAQPFGGYGLSGTGPKLGGYFYLQKLSREQWKIPSLTREATPDTTALTTTEKLIHETGLAHEIRVQLAELAGKSRIHNLRYAKIDLDSTCGEENVMTWRSPKHIWINGGTLQTAFAALLQIAAAGMQAVVHTQHPLAGWQTRLNGILRISNNPQQLPFVSHLVALDLPEPSLKMDLAARKGAIVRIINAQTGLDILQLFEEVAYSTDTTIAKSNPSLLLQAAEPMQEQLHS